MMVLTRQLRRCEYVVVCLLMRDLLMGPWSIYDGCTPLRLQALIFTKCFEVNIKSQGTAMTPICQCSRGGIVLIVRRLTRRTLIGLLLPWVVPA